MNIGMLWFDNNTKDDFGARVERAASYYQTKYGKRPNLCYVHPSMLAGLLAGEQKPEEANAIQSGGVEVRPTRAVRPNHFWIGVNGQIGAAAGR